MIKGFSKLTKKAKRTFVTDRLSSEDVVNIMNSDVISDKKVEKLLDELSENVISVYPLPFSVAPNFIIDGIEYIVPMVTEESSVVAAASKSAGYWGARGGFHTQILGTKKTGQIYFKYPGQIDKLERFFHKSKQDIVQSVSHINAGMVKRGGGIIGIGLERKPGTFQDLFKLNVDFETCDAMGANFMNSCLEGMAAFLHQKSLSADSGLGAEIEVIMSILSNYSPESAIRVFVECPISELDDGKLNMPVMNFAEKFKNAVTIAETDIERAVTHNKGLFNGVDAVALATGNDWRAIEANGHAFASSSGKYKSLSLVRLKDNMFHFEATLPLQVGTIGGITNLHPLAKLSLEILQNPPATELMKVLASAGLASNFAAVRSLVTTGIQKGHMKMHLNNILIQLNASEEERRMVGQHFQEQEVSYAAVKNYLEEVRTKKNI
jgi:hydroxymethylglutaryl-CoA reductase